MTNDVLSSSNTVIFQRELVILAQRVAEPVLGEQDAAQVGVAAKPDAAEIVDLALVPVGRLPRGSDRGNLRQLARPVVLPARQRNLEREPMLVRETLKVVDHLDMRLKAGLGRFLRIRLQVIDAADVREKFETQPRVIAQK